MIITTTLSPESLPGLAGVLKALGLTVRESPLLRFTRGRDWSELDAALSHCEQFTAVALSSPRAARVLRERLMALSPNVAHSLPVVWAVGPATAAELEGVAQVRIAAPGSDAQALATQMLDEGVTGPVLYPCGEDHRDELPNRLAARGVAVRPIVCYAGRLASDVEMADALAKTDLVLIGSHRVLTAVARIKPAGERPALICLGPSTARSARALGWEPAAVAGTPTVAGVSRAVRSLRSARRD
jgi:uroporphyrinogen-III synthase